jgi:hypothetical protein
VVYNSAEGFASGDYSTLIITDGGNAIPHMWGNTSQYLSRFANAFYASNHHSQTLLLQSWPFIKDGNLSEWREKIDDYLPRWNKVVNTVNGHISASTDHESLYYIPEDEQLAQAANRLKLIPAAHALSRVYDQYQQDNLPAGGRAFISEMFKSPDYSINPADNGQHRIGHLSPEGEYLIALVMHTAVYGRNPLLSTNNIGFNHRGWSGYSDKLFPQTPFPASGELAPAKAQYYQQVALDVVSEFYGWDKTTLPARQDSDEDGVFDHLDAFPNDASETIDSDGDGVGDNGDVFPNDPSETMDSDGDGIGDNADTSPNGTTDPTVPQVALTSIGFVNVEPSDTSVHVYWSSGHAIAFRLLLMRHNQVPRVFTTTETEYTFTDLSAFDGISSLMIEGYDSLGNSIFSSAVNVEDL